MKHLQLQLKMDTFSVFKVKETLKYPIQIFLLSANVLKLLLEFFCNVRCVFYVFHDVINQIFSVCT